jgi:hypothetical protein
VKKPSAGTERPQGFAIEHGASWAHWAKRRTGAELEEIAARLRQLQVGFGQPHLHAGLGLRRLGPRLFEFRLTRGLRVVCVLIKPRTFRLAMTGSHDEVRAWLKENS